MFGRPKIFYSRALPIWRILELYADTFRVRRVERIAPTRIGTFLNDNGTEVLYYTIDGNRIPETGVGSVVVFYGNDEGLIKPSRDHY
jgi:hypothetical protein